MRGTLSDGPRYIVARHGARGPECPAYRCGGHSAPYGQAMRPPLIGWPTVTERSAVNDDLEHT